MVEEKKRILWVDIFKAFMVLFVAFGHTSYDFELAGFTCNMYVLSFHVPGFFFVSGYLFSRKDISFSKFVKNKFKSLMIPYYIFAIISFVVYMVLGSLIYSNLDVEVKSMDALGNFIGIFYANGLTGYMKWNLSLWFIPCYFIVLILFFFVSRLVVALEKRLNFNFAVIIVMFGLLGLAFINYYILQLKYLPFGLEVSFYMLPVMLFGYWLRQKINLDVLSKSVQFLVAVALIVIGGAITLSYQNYVSVVSSWYGDNLCVFYFSLLSSLLGYMFLSNVITSKALTYVGQNTLAILLMHKFPIMLFQLFLEERMKTSSLFNVGSSIVIVIVACTLSLLCGAVITRIAPFVIGKQKK